MWLSVGNSSGAEKFSPNIIIDELLKAQEADGSWGTDNVSSATAIVGNSLLVSQRQLSYRSEEIISAVTRAYALLVRLKLRPGSAEYYDRLVIFRNIRECIALKVEDTSLEDYVTAERLPERFHELVYALQPDSVTVYASSSSAKPISVAKAIVEFELLDRCADPRIEYELRTHLRFILEWARTWHRTGEGYLWDIFLQNVDTNAREDHRLLSQAYYLLTYSSFYSKWAGSGTGSYWAPAYEAAERREKASKK
jgi:hypothetical protein